ncbi:MAG: 30S ribosomal protein S9 [Anaerolineaceae bacterium]|nr:30S ribosomal protein S9 [Anaerolineaceae bacterium]
MPVQYYEGIGRRKESSARVRIMSGSGKFTVNEKPLEHYFPRTGDMEAILGPLSAVSQDRATFDITATVYGGGVTGQTDSVQRGLARAWVKLDVENTSPLRKGGFLTRDPRIKERKKPGLKRARKAPTYTKR